ncbi:MAG TPA: GH3 auxin-responsive promoter family protein, partial [Ktedonobacteraceae bacterium]
AKYTLNTTFWMMAPEWPDETRPFYTLFIQFTPDAVSNEKQLRDVASEIDKAMQDSYHYEYSRRLGQLDHCRLFVIAPNSEAFHTYLAVCTDLGQRLGDIKPAVLHAYQGWSSRFTGRFVDGL